MTRDEMGALYDKFSGLVYRAALSYCRNVQDAEDVMQDVFLKRFTLDRSFPDEGQEKAWLIRMTVNRCKNLLKAVSRHRSVPLEDAEALCVTEEESGIWEAVASLPPKYRLVIQLYYGEGYSVAEIAAAARRSETAVQTQLYRARRLLRDILGEERCFVYGHDLFGHAGYAAEERGYRYFLTFDKPLDMNGLTAIRINGTELPIT